MQIEFTITAQNKDLFNIKLTEQLMGVFSDVNIDNTKIIAVQFKDADPFAIDKFIGQFNRYDGTYLYEGKYYWRDELCKIVQPYCKTCSISIAEKDLGAKYPESEKQRRFGYINYAEYHVEQSKVEEV